MKCPRARAKGLVIEQAGETSLVVIDRQACCAHSLGAASSFVFRRCDGKRSIATIAKELHDALGLPEDETIVRAALASLSRAGLLEEAFAQPAPRRALVKRLAATGVLALTTLSYLPRASAHDGRHDVRVTAPTHADAAKTPKQRRAHAKLPMGPFGGPVVGKLFIT